MTKNDQTSRGSNLTENFKEKKNENERKIKERTEREENKKE